MDINSFHSHYHRILEEVAGLIGEHGQKDVLLQGGHVKVGDYVAWFIYDESLDAPYMYVYVDIGAPAEEKAADAYRRLLRFNLQLLGSSVFGTTGLHPDNNHVIYTYRYPLAPYSSGQGLMDSLIKVVNGLSLDDLPSAVPDRTRDKNGERTH